MKLSLCIATFNEEKFIHYPLDSAHDLVDEIIIVDGGSHDKTIQIAKSYGKKVRVIITTNPPMFHINKQKALDAARGEWVLQLDADEALSEGLKNEIIGLLRNEKSAGIVAFWLPRKNFFLGRFLTKGGQYPDYTIRLYRRGTAHFPLKSVHENVEIKGKVGYLKNPLLHYADPEFARYLRRWKRYNALDAMALKRKFKVQSSKFKVLIVGAQYIFVKPFLTFVFLYVRHKGFMDGWPGFVFAFFSSIRFIPIYFKAIRKSA